MEVVTRTAASQLGLSQRQVQRLARSGRMVSRAVAGRTVIGNRSLVAMSRSMGRGRQWEDQTAAAAAELLENGITVRITGSQRSRLRGRLRTIAMPELAYQMLGARVTLWRSTRLAADSNARTTDGLSATGEHLNVEIVRDAAAFARHSRLLEDPEGDTLLVELDTDAPAVVEDVALYAYGDARTSSAARQRIEARKSSAQ